MASRTISYDGSHRLVSTPFRLLGAALAAALLAALLPLAAAVAADEHEEQRAEDRKRSTYLEPGDGDGDDALEMATMSAAAAQNITPVTRDGDGATRLAEAMMRTPGQLRSARFAAVPPAGTPHGVARSVTWFPTRGEEFAILTSGDATLADQPGAYASVSLGGGSVRGNSDRDVTILELELDIPAGANCLRFDFSFYSTEYPTYVGSAYNDAFLAELGPASWTTQGSAISAPNNFAFDPTGAPVTINSSGYTSMSSALAAGTGYGGGTELLQAGTPVSPGVQKVTLSIFDQGDNILDSAVFVDDLHATQVRDVATMCISGVKRSGDLPPLQREQTFGGWPGIHGNNPTGAGGDPVNTATGSFFTQVTDASLPGAGVPFSFTRSYNSLDDRDGPLGRGWTHTFTASLDVDDDGDVTLRGEDGQQMRYRLEDDGSFVAMPGGRSTLRSTDDGFELERDDGIRYHFDAAGSLVAMVDRNGQGLSLAYGPDGLLASVTDAAGRTTGVTHTDGRLTALALPDGREVRYAYTDGLLTAVTDVRGNTERYAYDDQGRVSEVRQADGEVLISNVYGPDGRVVEQTDGTGARSTFSWDPETETSTIVDPDGGVHRDIYRDLVLVERIDPLGNHVVLGYDDDYNLTSITDPRGHTTEMAHDTRGNVVSMTDPSGAVQTFEYGPHNTVTSATDSLGRTTTFSYDEAGNVTAITQPDGSEISFERDPVTGVVTAETNALGHTTSFSYDDMGNVTRIENALGHATEISYDTAGRATAVVDGRGLLPDVDPSAFRSTLSYDEAGNLVELRDPAGNVTTRTYDENHRLVSEVDAEGRERTWTYDEMGRVASVTAPDGATTAYTYDAVGNLVTRTDPLGRVTTYSYDKGRRLVGVTSPEGQRWTYRYDEVGNIVEMVDAVGNAGEGPTEERVTTYAYDALNRLVGVAYGTGNADGEAGGEAEADAASAAGSTTVKVKPLRLRSLCSPNPRATRHWQVDNPNTFPVSTEYEIFHSDVAGTHTAQPGETVFTTATQRGNNTMELRWEDGRTIRGSGMVACKDGGTDPDPDPDPELPQPTTPSVVFTYDANGNRTAMHDGAGTVTYDYDEADRLIEVARDDEVYSYEYDAAGRITRRSFPDGTDMTYAYDAAGRLSSAVADGETTTYGWDPLGNLLEATLPNGTTTEHDYDVAGQVSAVRHLDATGALLAAYGYERDRVGNPTAVDTPFGRVGLGYDDRDQLTEVCYDPSCEEFITYAYDAAGNRVLEGRPEGDTTYTYDAADRLLTTSGPEGTVTYDHDANGNRTQAGAWRSVYDAAGNLAATAGEGQLLTYTYDGDGRRLTGGPQGAATRYGWDPNAIVPLLASEDRPDGTVTYLHGAQPIGLRSDEGTSYLHADALGSIGLMTGADGAVQTAYDYEPFGAARAVVQHQDGAPDNLLRFTGQLLDEVTGQYHLRARQYDPAVGRFTSTDPVMHAVTDPFVASYLYVNNRPTVLVDPLGLFCLVGKNPDGSCRGASPLRTTLEVTAEISGKATLPLAGVAAGCAALVICAPAAPVALFASGVAGTVSMASSTALGAWDCADAPSWKSCGSAVASVAVDVTIGKVTKHVNTQIWNRGGSRVERRRLMNQVEAGGHVVGGAIDAWSQWGPGLPRGSGRFGAGS